MTDKTPRSTITPVNPEDIGGTPEYWGMTPDEHRAMFPHSYPPDGQERRQLAERFRDLGVPSNPNG